ncbi:MAG: hypothetical protein HYW48_04940 [Deltaproteobacteria bacterium]|nr:hypothetical protein [Deltaproteobacteria bacterium]
MEETAQLVPPRKIYGGATVPSPPQTPLSLFAPHALRVTQSLPGWNLPARLYC